MLFSWGFDLLVAVAGASGFIGKNLIKELVSSHKIRGLSRSDRDPSANLEWKSTDLFSFESTDEAMRGSEVGIFLVHSMLPSSRLFQGNFQDTDLMLADNFAQACVKNNIKQIIYLGGLVPTSGISKHLASRKEVEDVFKSTKIPLTILRAGMVVGDGGSSFEILKNLVLNLPGMILPQWTKSNTQAIFIEDLTSVIGESIGNEKYFNKTIDVVNGEKISYKELMRQTAEGLGRKTIMLPVPINYTSFSKLWVRIFGETDYELVSPLIDSLLCDLPHPSTPEEISHLIKFKTYKSMLNAISRTKVKKKKAKKNFGPKNVRSIQRLSNPGKLSQSRISEEYVHWLPEYLRSFIRAEKNDDEIDFLINGLNKPLLKLSKIEDKNELDRIKFHIVGGLLVQDKESGWLEFRLVANGKYTLVSINDFVPSLPWYLYKYTQAPFHSKVMNAFGKYLERMSQK
jgi:nucleoside-diphosphate-sugar epimerase